MVLHRADYAWVVRPVPYGWFENNSLVVALALAFRFDAIATGRSFLPTLDTAFSACQTASLGPLPQFRIYGGSRAFASWGNVTSIGRG